MIPHSHSDIIGRVVTKVDSDIKLLLKNNGALLAQKFQRYIKTENGWQTDHTCKVDTIIDWMRTFESLYGQRFENMQLMDELTKYLNQFYSGSFPPGRNSFGTDINYEVKLFISEIFSSCTTFVPNYKLPPIATICKVTYDFLIRSKDVYVAEIPLLGIKVNRGIKFNYGEIAPLSFDEAVDFLRDITHPSRSPRQPDPNLLAAKALLKVEFEVTRGTSTLICPNELVDLARNTVQLLRLYQYGGASAAYTRLYMKAIDDRSSGGISSSLRASLNQVYDVESAEDLKNFLNKHLSITPLEDHSLGFIVTRISETWEKSRSEEFKIFDYVSILEALLTKSQAELTYRVSISAAFLLAQSPSEKKEIFNLIKKAYKIRSLVAHCAPKIDSKNMLTQKEMDYLGRLVHKTIRSGFDFGVKQLRIMTEDKILS